MVGASAPTPFDMEMDMKKQLSARQKQMLDLWMKGHSGLRIAQMLGTSRSAVLGMLKRIREWGHSTDRKMKPTAHRDKPRAPKTPPKPPVERKAPANLVRLAVIRKPIISEPKPDPVAPPPKPVESPKYVKFADLKWDHCRYVMNNGHPSTFLFCGKPKWRFSFCKEHHSIVYVPTPPKKR